MGTWVMVKQVCSVHTTSRFHIEQVYCMLIDKLESDKIIAIMQWIWAFWVQFLKPVSEMGTSPFLEYQVIQDWIISLLFAIEIRDGKWDHNPLVRKLVLMLVMLLMKKGGTELCGGTLDNSRKKKAPLEEAKSECHFCVTLSLGVILESEDIYWRSQTKAHQYVLLQH